jgi:hypothetical protein
MITRVVFGEFAHVEVIYFRLFSRIVSLGWVPWKTKLARPAAKKKGFG